MVLSWWERSTFVKDYGNTISVCAGHMWAIDALRGWPGFFVPKTALGLFRIAFGSACLIKFVVEACRGHLQLVDSGTFLCFKYHGAKPWIQVTGKRYRILYLLKIVAALGITAGIFLRPALATLVATLWLDLRIYFKFHANLMFLIAAILLISPSPGSSLTLSTLAQCHWSLRLWLIESSRTMASPYANLMIVGTMTIVYLSTALRKMNRTFLDGVVLASQMDFIYGERLKRKSFDFWIPIMMRPVLLGGDLGRAANFWKPWVRITVGLELILPFLLFTQHGWVVGAIAGLIMHLMFTLLYPLTLGHFSGLSVATYILFADPRIVAASVIRAVGGG